MRVILRIFALFLLGTEIGTSLLYLGLSISPSLITPYVDPEFISKLSIIMMMEFIMAHSGVFFNVFVGNMRKVDAKNDPSNLISNINIFNGKMKFSIILSLYLIYLTFAAAFAGWYGVLIYTLLTISRSYFILFRKDFKIKPEIIKSFSRAGIYVLSIGFVLVTEMRLGSYDSNLNISNLGGDLTPLNFLNWGFIYFGFTGLLNMAIDYKFYSKR